MTSGRHCVQVSEPGGHLHERQIAFPRPEGSWGCDAHREGEAEEEHFLQMQDTYDFICMQDSEKIEHQCGKMRGVINQ